ncbi:acetyl-CoA synthetase-like protein [Hortaea werneckii]|nr:acetyl-CoA synthetase-like protein [Hortaea werneckii]KAI7230307.1 acetyl-CoA synthetase-like protein [Hortaea werneckii]KAI7322030.1 acetyl-CoA synthetase-like protein [Hortaea werneckii]
MEDLTRPLGVQLLEQSELKSLETIIKDEENQSIDCYQLLASVDRLCDVGGTYLPIVALVALLSKREGLWPVFQLQQSYVRAWKSLSEEAKAGHAPIEAQQLVRHCLALCKQSYGSLLDLFQPKSDSVAIINPENGQSSHHGALYSILKRFSLPLPASSSSRKPIVAISLPNGPLLALTVLAVASYYTAAPIAHGNGVGPEQFKADVLQSKSDMVLASGADIDRLHLRDSWLVEAGITVLLIELTGEMSLVVKNVQGKAISSDLPPPAPNNADDMGIMLFTSGTSGTKKLVPLHIHSMVCGIAMVIESWGLSPSMRCLNQMPLNHVGGLIRNLFAPIMSGGSVICCSAFDANQFWDCVEDYAPTWYYASPSMHQCILEAATERPETVQKGQIRLVCNAAGGLLPSLACRLRDAFSTETTHCTVLPSYGMTECMPISTPPLSYCLDRPGTSGISVGPELAVIDGHGQRVNHGVVGRISVRGAPVFGGYLQADNHVDVSCFTDDGWFDTGDMGFLDPDGYLFITGRSKEVINRGGELISPFEVEEAVVSAASIQGSATFGRISKALAFSVAHDVLQEVVGIAVVTPEGAQRSCLRDIQESVAPLLGSIKIPVLVVFMDHRLPTNNNKVLRIKLADRLGLPEISDQTPHFQRHYQAITPPPNTPLQTTIECELLPRSNHLLLEACAELVPTRFDYHVRSNSSDFYPELFLAPRNSFEVAPIGEEEDFVGRLKNILPGYYAPSKIHRLRNAFPRLPGGQVNESKLAFQLESTAIPSPHADMNNTEAIVAKLFAQTLSLSVDDICRDSDFFDLGGSSMAAGQFLSKLRKEFEMRLPIDVLFTTRKVSALAALIQERMKETESLISKATAAAAAAHVKPPLLPGCEETCSSTKAALLALQLLPLIIIYPMKRAFTWTVFIYFLTYTQGWATNQTILGRLLDLCISMFVARTITRTVAPLLAITFKWLVIGKYKEGLYPMWSRYHTRWWLCQKVIDIAGMGNFGICNTTRAAYYRMLGATIGRNVSIQKGATLGEYDLVSIGDEAVLDRCIVRPFGAERNTSMYLGRISIGPRAVIGTASIVAPGTNVPENACLGPNTSSWEVADADESNRDLAPSRIPAAHWTLNLFAGLPIQFLAKFAGAMPWLLCLLALVSHKPHDEVNDMLREVCIWFSGENRVGLHYAALSANAVLSPVAYFFAVYLVKKSFDLALGTVRPSRADQQSNVSKFRAQLLRSLMPAPAFHSLSELFGTHYEKTSQLARLMGAKVGKRVYWPGTGPSIQDFPLLEIGDDVVFGSRSHLVTSDGSGSEPIRIRSGAMVADRVVLLPGVELGERTVMGSGALTKRDSQYASDTTWVGAKKGEAVCLTTTEPEGKERSSLQAGELSTGCNLSVNDVVSSPYNRSDINSTSTTLVLPLDSEASSIAFAEKGTLRHHHFDTKISQTSIKTGNATSVTVHEVDSSGSLDTEAESSSPFGRAFYQGKATYKVWSQSTITFYSTLVALSTAIFWNIGSISAVQVIGHAYENNTILSQHFLGQNNLRPLALYVYFTGIIIAIMAAQSVFVLALLIGSKWVLIGRRQQGNYDWDKSPYCQRWQLFLKLESLRRHCYGGHGILGMLTGTHWIVLYFRAMGLKCGKDCALFAGGLPSLMFTEPDLLTLGDRVSVDDASLVGHINTRGKFDLNPLHVGDRSVLRSGSRLLSGARMEADTCLLEHTLIMAGDVVDEGSTSQGWPAEEFKGSRTPTLKAGQTWKVEKA